MIEGSLLIPLLLIIILIIISAFFSGSETGLTAVSRAKIHKLTNEGHKRAAQVSALRKDKDRLIGTILLGNNLVNIAASALATALAIHYWGESGVLYATIAMTLLVLVFAEVMPKTYAFAHSEKTALGVAPIFSILVKILSPITAAIQALVNLVMKVLGMQLESVKEVSDTEALRGSIELHHDAGVVVKDDKDMLGSILDLNEIEIEEIMIHRKQMETIDGNQNPEDIVQQVLKSPYTRIPVWDGGESENIIGVLHAKDLLRVIQAKNGQGITTVDIYSILMEPWFVPETTTLKDQLQAFLARKNHFALVVDEYGDLQGLVTLEDILEEIVGQIEDEYDTESKDSKIIKEDDYSYIVDGTLTVRDLNRKLDWDLPDDEASTIAGLVIHEAQHIPERGQIFHFYNCRFEILEKQRNQITRLRVSNINKT